MAHFSAGDRVAVKGRVLRLEGTRVVCEFGGVEVTVNAADVTAVSDWKPIWRAERVEAPAAGLRPQATLHPTRLGG